MSAQTKESQDSISPEMALNILKEGNQRFVNDTRTDHNLLQQVQQTGGGQFPFAVVLSCIDSRVPAEIVFDQGVGDIFSARIAGNFVNDDILGSMEFACNLAGSKLIVVMGHTSCGAVKGACNDVKLGNLTGLLSKIKPAIDSVEEDGVRDASNANFVQKVADKNVELTIKDIRKRSEVLKQMLELNAIGIVGAMYDVQNGKVSFGELEYS